MAGLNWLDWDKSAFLKAKKEKKPILLGISAKWCHWCHTMDRLTYSNKEIIEFINNNFVPIRVDTDERPDVNDRYNVGGWPTTAVLAHDGEIVSAATYVSPEHMIKFLEDAISRFKKYKPKKAKKEEPSKPLPFDQEYFWKMIKSFYDPVNGGFGLEPKFPHHEILGYLVWRVMKLKDKDAAKMLDFTLSKMLKGEIFDGAGGFFRYATLQNWTIPHFEKMLEDNSRLLAYYLFAYRVFKKEEYLTAANKTLFWLVSMMYDREKGVFYASQDADEGYCKLPLSERVHREPPAIDRRIFTDCNAAMIMALSEAAILDPEYDKVALKLLESLYKLSVRGCVAHCYPAEKPLFLFKDHAYLLLGLLWAFKRTNKLEWKSKAMTVAKALERFYDKKNGGFFDILASKDSVGRLKERKKIVNDNAFAALVLFQFAQVSQDSKYVKMAQKTLQAVSSQAMMMGPYAAGYAVAVGELQNNI
jgi:hypothetical protein